MSSTISTSRSSMSRSRSLRMRTTPDDDVDDPYELTAMNSSCAGTGIARARSVTKKTAPLSTLMSSRSWEFRRWCRGSPRRPVHRARRPCAWISSDESSTDLMSPGYSSADLLSHVHSVPCLHTGSVCSVSIPSRRPGDQPLAAQRRPDRHTALPAPRRDQSVHPADLLVGQPAGAARQQPAPNHPAPDRLRKCRQSGGVQPAAGADLGQRPAWPVRRASRCPRAARSRCGPAPRRPRRRAPPPAAAAPRCAAGSG